MTRPNIILCTCDQLRAHEMGCYGNDVIRTPNIVLDRTGLAENTIVVFTSDHGDNLGNLDWREMRIE